MTVTIIKAYLQLYLQQIVRSPEGQPPSQLLSHAVVDSYNLWAHRFRQWLCTQWHRHCDVKGFRRSSSELQETRTPGANAAVTPMLRSGRFSITGGKDVFRRTFSGATE